MTEIESCTLPHDVFLYSYEKFLKEDLQLLETNPTKTLHSFEELILKANAADEYVGFNFYSSMISPLIATYPKLCNCNDEYLKEMNVQEIVK